MKANGLGMNPFKLMRRDSSSFAQAEQLLTAEAIRVMKPPQTTQYVMSPPQS
jgi:hypothetical protein